MISGLANHESRASASGSANSIQRRLVRASVTAYSVSRPYAVSAIPAATTFGTCAGGVTIGSRVSID